jgi:hypothetical protein
MSTTLTPLLASYVESMNANDSAAFTTNFAADAIVHDEGHEHRGTAAIKAWIEEAHRKYQPTLEVTGVAESGGETILTGLVSGTFDGSPLELHHHLTIAGNKIVALAIKA